MLTFLICVLALEQITITFSVSLSARFETYESPLDICNRTSHQVKSEILKDFLKMLILIQGGSRNVKRRLGKVEDLKFTRRIAKQLVGEFSESNTGAYT